MKSILILLVSFVISFFIVPVFRTIALKLEIVDHPNYRKIHVEPTPLLGGGSIFFTFLVLLVGLKYTGIIQFENPKSVYGIMLSGTLMFITGLIDDMYGIKAKLKLFLQIVAVLTLFIFEVKTELFIGGVIFSLIVTFIWAIGITNSFNLLDNMNGLSSGVAFIAAILFAIVAAQQKEYGIMYIALILAGAILGFIPYNFRTKAKIFMGDAGSLFLGITFSAISIAGVYLRETRLNHIPVIIPLLILSLPIYDTLSVMFIRWRQGISIFTPDKRHLSHRLIELGLTPIEAVALIYLVAAAGGIGAVFLNQLNLMGAVLVIVQTLAIYAILTILIFLGKREIFKLKNGNNDVEIK